MRHLLLTLLLAAAPILTAAANLPADSLPAVATPARSTTFAWGVDIGSSIDLSGSDMSNINFSASLGLKNRAFHMLGVGGGIDMMMGNSGRSFPVFAIAQTSFGRPKAPCFGELRAGVAFNNLDDNYSQASLYLSPGFGVNLARGASYRSFLVISYVYNGLKYPGDASGDIQPFHGLHYANVTIGITF